MATQLDAQGVGLRVLFKRSDVRSYGYLTPEQVGASWSRLSGVQVNSTFSFLYHYSSSLSLAVVAVHSHVRLFVLLVRLPSQFLALIDSVCLLQPTDQQLLLGMDLGLCTTFQRETYLALEYFVSSSFSPPPTHPPCRPGVMLCGSEGERIEYSTVFSRSVSGLGAGAVACI